MRALFLAAAPLMGIALTAATVPDTSHWSLTMTPDQEVPAPGEPGSSGTATVDVNSATGQICYTLSVSGLTPATMAHIHKAAAGTAGPVAMVLTTPDASGNAKGCGTDAKLAKAIVANPADYYVNVHTADHPKGALRAQLSAAN